MTNSILPLISLFFLLAYMGCGAYCKGIDCHIPNRHKPDAKIMGRYGEFLSDSEIDMILKKWNTKTLNPRLYRFFTDPTFRYDLNTHYDLGIEDDFAIFWPSPLTSHSDRSFLVDINLNYPHEIDSLRSKLKTPSLFSIQYVTRLANNSTADLLNSAENDIFKMNLIRKTFFHCLMSY